jgi:hypothetical protein
MKTAIELAREAGFAITVSTDPNSPPSWWGAGHDDRFKVIVALARADEREACAKFFDGKVGQADLRDIAAAIRNRGNT